ncbi:hydrogenase maturation protease [Nonomuraea sp. NPDC050643]|uniref:hydrogenase maturation protease n=1 Tax=Nonomuraea sp. NPDC050643 TaxID=3155660 RepID=UPI0033FDFA47
MTGRVLVAGVGNVFLGDDGFGVEVARRLSVMGLPGRVRVADYGIRGLHLAYDTAAGAYDMMIMVDAVSLGDPPGTVSVIELEGGGAFEPKGGGALDAHGMPPEAVFTLVERLGALPGRVLLVGCEPASLEHRMGLSPAVERAVGAAVEAVVDLIEGN